VVDLSDLEGVVCKVVVDDVGEVIEASVEPQDFSVVVEELLLRGYTAAAERLLHEFLQIGGVSGLGLLHNRLSVAIDGDRDGCSLGFALGFEEVAGVVIAIRDAEGLPEDHEVGSNLEVRGEQGSPAGLKDLLTLEELALGHAGVDFLWLADHDRVVL